MFGEYDNTEENRQTEKKDLDERVNISYDANNLNREQSSETISNHYFITRKNNLDDLVEELEGIKGITIQHIYKSIATVAIEVTEENVLNVLKEQYDIEEQHRVSYHIENKPIDDRYIEDKCIGNKPIDDRHIENKPIKDRYRE